MVAARPGERAFDVAEQFRFEQFGRNRTAVDRDERLVWRGLARWIARASSSLPVPDSPWIRTDASLWRPAGLRPAARPSPGWR